MEARNKPDDFKRLSCAIEARDLKRITQIIAEGADLDARGHYGESIVLQAARALQSDELRYQIVQTLLDHGADPRILDRDRSGPLIYAILGMDTRMLAMLLEHGADPNVEGAELPSESLYDFAVFDYLYEVADATLPEKPAEADKVDPDTWLAFLHRLASDHGWPAPDHLSLLRSHGAMTAQELHA